MPAMDDETTLIYDRLGGPESFFSLVEEFYRRVENDTLLRPLYPDDLTAPQEHMALFLIQRFGGPTHYSDNRGHPRLRMRHMPFQIGVAERDAWLDHMNAAVDSIPAFAPYREILRRYFTDSAAFLVNHSGTERAA
jgi:hemoglobin